MEKARWALALVLGVGAVLAGAGARPAAAQEETVIGTSQGGRPLVVARLGGGPARVMILGGQHGGPEANTVELVRELLDHFGSAPGELPAGVGLDVMAVANPDGYADGSRQLLSGVDPNRNWGGSDWRADAYDSNARFRVGLGGPEPFSEPETQALANWVLQTRPAMVINYHSAGGFLFGAHDGPTGELAGAFADATGYMWPVPGQGRSPLAYSATGSMNVWLREAGIAGILVELTNPWNPEFDRNLAGVQAVLARVAAGAGAGSGAGAGGPGSGAAGGG